jgi:Fe-S-cluster-containing hydrogenase component 2
VEKGRIPVIAVAILGRKVSVPEGSDSLLMTYSMNTVIASPKRCVTCGRICPTRNITVTDDAVHWGNACVQCYACIHWCQKEAVEIGARTVGKKRYYHPDVTIRDMLDQRGKYLRRCSVCCTGVAQELLVANLMKNKKNMVNKSGSVPVPEYTKADNRGPRCPCPWNHWLSSHRRTVSPARLRWLPRHGGWHT